MSDQLQRLWYTAPQVKRNDSRLSKGGERFRICAVTPELNEDIYTTGGAQVRALERYARYTPPDGTTRDDASLYGEQDQAPMPPDLDGLRPNDSPICLSLIEIQNPEVLNSPMLAEKLRGRVLVNKVYLGVTGDGREGNFFIDLLSHMPEGFSAREALALWRSPFWQRLYYSDSPSSNFRDELPPVELPPALLQELNRRRLSQTSQDVASSVLPVGIQNPFAQFSSLSEETMRKLKKLLTFLIHAYLIQQHEEWTERTKQATRRAKINKELAALPKSKSKMKERDEAEEAYRQMRFKRIYLAAEDDQVAYCLMLLASLFQDIPVLLQPLTFSTYEYEVLKSECLIVATSPSRAWEKNGIKLETLLPPECEKLGFLYNAYDKTRNTQFPQRYAIENLSSPLLVEAVARDLARNLLKPTKRFEKYHAVAHRIPDPAQTRISPAIQLVLHWQKQLPKFENRHLRRAEVEQLLTLPEWQDELEERETRWKMLQWVVADRKGLDLDQRPQDHSIHPPFRSTLDPAGKPPTSQTLLWLGKFCKKGDSQLVFALASSSLECLKVYADNQAQPEASFTSSDYEEDPELQHATASKQPPFDLILFCQQARDPEAFIALLIVLQLCEPIEKGASSWTALLKYLLSQQKQDGRKVFQHPDAGAFVLRHLYDTNLLPKSKEAHLTIHTTLLLDCALVFQEEHNDLITPLLEVPLSYYWELLENDSERRTLYLSWRKKVLLYQLNKLKPGARVEWFTGAFWETYLFTPDDTQKHRELLQQHWQTHLLLVTEALDCLTDWKDALPLVDEKSPSFHPELIRKLEKPELAKSLQDVIRQQMSTKQPENKKVVSALYEKLLQCGYSETSILLLLDAWHEAWYQGDLSSEELRSLLNSTKNLSQTALGRLLLRYKEAYKAKQAEVILTDLYERYIWQDHEERWQEMLFELFEGRFVSQKTLDALFPLAQLSTLGKVEFFARFGPTSLPEYFRHPRQERSKELLKLFTSLTEEYQDLPDQTLKLGQPLVPVDRPVLLAILSLWLAVTPFAEAGTIQFLIDRAILDWVNAPGRKNNRPQEELAREELASILATFGSQYMASGKRELREICWQYFQWLCPDGKLHPALKLQMCMTLLPPDLFPFTTTPLSLDETLHILNTARLGHEPTTSSPFVSELRRHLAEQKNIAQIRAGQLTTFLAQQERSVDQFGQQLQDFLAPSSGRASELSETLETFLRKQVRAGTSYQPSELELFLEFQEYRGQALRSEVSGMPLAIYLHYVDSSEKKRAEPCRELYQRYLRHIQIENLERRQETVELLKRLSGTGALDKTIHVLAEGLLGFVDFLQSANRQQQQLVRRVAEKDTSPLSTSMLGNLRSSLYSLKQEKYREDYYNQITDKIVSTFVKCITSESDIERILNLKLGEPLSRSEERYSGFILLLDMSACARTDYAQPESHWWLPYLLFLPKLGTELEIREKEALYSFQSKVLDKLLLVQKQVDLPTVRAIDIYVQQEAATNSSKEVVEIWQAYKQASGISTLLIEAQPTLALVQKALSAGGQKSVTPLVSGEVNTEPVEVQAASATARDAANIVFANTEEFMKVSRVSRFESFQVVYNMRQAIRNADRRSLRKLWETPKKYYILLQHYKEVEKVYWERFQSIRWLDKAYLALLREENNPETQQQFMECVTKCQEFEGKHRLWWKTCIEKEQFEKYQELVHKHTTGDRGTN